MHSHIADRTQFPISFVTEVDPGDVPSYHDIQIPDTPPCFGPLS